MSIQQLGEHDNYCNVLLIAESKVSPFCYLIFTGAGKSW